MALAFVTPGAEALPGLRARAKRLRLTVVGRDGTPGRSSPGLIEAGARSRRRRGRGSAFPWPRARASLKGEVVELAGDLGEVFPGLTARASLKRPVDAVVDILVRDRSRVFAPGSH